MYFSHMVTKCVIFDFPAEAMGERLFRPQGKDGAGLCVCSSMQLTEDVWLHTGIS